MTGTGPTWWNELPPNADAKTVLDRMAEAAQSTYDDTLNGLVRAYPAVSVDDVYDALLRVGKNNGPALLCDLFQEGCLHAEAATAHVGSVWSMAEYPNQYLDTEDWRDLFDLAGFTIDGRLAARPTEPVRLYRGSVPERRTDWSWSTSREVAEKYAAGGFGGIYGRPAGVLWTALVPPEWLLAENTRRDEAEYVVDTDGLKIVRVD